MNKKNFILIILIVILLLLIIPLSTCFRSVPTGFVGIRLIFGKANSNLVSEGLNLKIPFIENTKS